MVVGGIGALLAFMSAAFFLVVHLALRGPDVDTIDFESAKWLAASVPDGTYNSVRLRMADSFLADERPIGKSRDQIVALLGEPNDTPYFSEYDMVYYLGPERGPMGIDSEWLVLKLKDGAVTEAQLVTD
jgi:hypothetical protein